MIHKLLIDFESDIFDNSIVIGNSDDIVSFLTYYSDVKFNKLVLDCSSLDRRLFNKLLKFFEENNGNDLQLLAKEPVPEAVISRSLYIVKNSLIKDCVLFDQYVAGELSQNNLDNINKFFNIK
jgi:hypothetical protein